MSAGVYESRSGSRRIAPFSARSCLLIPLLIVERFDPLIPGKPGSPWSLSFHNQSKAQ
jgi:hypothetical protein